MSLRLRTSWVIAGLAGVLLVGLAAGYGVRAITSPVAVRIGPPIPAPTPRPTPPLMPAQYPLTIPAQRARTYPGGELKVEEDQGNRGAYSLSRVSYPSDGYRVYGLMATPTATRPLFGYPVVILTHGFQTPDSYRTEGPEYQEYMRALATHGYVVIKPDLRGHDRSWGVARGAYFSSDYTTDVLNLAASLASNTSLDNRSVGLWGYSMGAYVSLVAMAVQPDRFRAGVIVAGPVGELDDMYYHWQAPSELGNPAATAERARVVRVFGAPRQNPDFWRLVSPLTYAGDITTPLQLHHGLADTLVPARFSQQLATALAAHGRSAEYLPYAAIGHSFTGKAQSQLIDKALQHFDTHLRR